MEGISRVHQPRQRDRFLAVGVVIGAAFGRIVTALVDGIIMPPFGLVLGRVDFASLFYVLDASKGVPLSLARCEGRRVSRSLPDGQFFDEVIAFLIVGSLYSC